MGASIPKQFLLLQGKPILHYTLQVFQASGLVDSIILVVPENDFEAAQKEWAKNFNIIEQVVVGGEKRQDSVANGLNALDAGTDIVIVHDGVRPFITRDIIEKTISAAEVHGAAITAIPVSDTIKQADAESFVTKTVDRTGLWRVQTPQAFKYDLFKEAMAKAMADSYYGTDEGSILEAAGKKVKIVEGSELNIKITRKEDLVLGERILNEMFP